MFQKIANALSIVSFIMVATMSGTAYYAYRFVTSEQFKAKIMNEVLDNVEGLMPKVLDNAMPEMTGRTIPEYNPPQSTPTK